MWPQRHFNLQDHCEPADGSSTQGCRLVQACAADEWKRCGRHAKQHKMTHHVAQQPDHPPGQALPGLVQASSSSCRSDLMLLWYPAALGSADHEPCQETRLCKFGSRSCWFCASVVVMEGTECAAVVVYGRPSVCCCHGYGRHCACSCTASWAPCDGNVGW